VQNDPTYCPSCKKVILEALRGVPVARVRDLIASTDFSVEDLLKIEKIEKATAAKTAQAGGLILPLRRVVPGLIDLQDLTNHNMRGYVFVEGKTYLYDYWTKDGPAKGTVQMVVERDGATGEVLGPWRDP